MPAKIPFGEVILAGALPPTSGSYRFVSSVIGSNNNTGKRPDKPVATWQKAHDLCTADANDVIVLLPGHAEAVTATSHACSKAGVQTIGLGTGLKRPTFTYGAASATITVSAANCSFSGIHHIANFLDVAAAYTLSTAKDCVIDSCTFRANSAILNFLSLVVTGATNNAADGLTFTNNWYQGLAATENAVISVLGNLDRLNVSGNFADKAATNNAGQFITLSSKIILAAQIRNNTLVVVGAVGTTVGIFLTGSGTTSTGIVANNYVASLDTTTELLTTAGTGLKFFENYYTGTADASGKLWPIVDVA